MAEPRYRDRMTREADVPPAELIPHPDNWRIHSELQRASVDAALSEIGLLQRIVVNERSGRVVDGHLRLALAVEHELPVVPVQYVELDEAEEAAALATFDPLGDLASHDPRKLALNIERANLDWLPQPGLGDWLAKLAPPPAPAAAGRPERPPQPEGVEAVEPVPVDGRLRALRWYGGKGRSLGLLLPLLDVPADAFVDAFGGGGHVLLNRPRAKSETLNDLDGDVVHFFRTLRDRGDELREALRLTPYARAEYEAARAALDAPPADELERARLFMLSTFSSVGARLGAGFANSIGSQSNNQRGFRSAVDALEGVVERLRGVSIERRDAIELLRQAKQPDALFYLDPPYLHGARKTPSDGYREELTDDGHEALLDAAAASPCLIAISGYPASLYDAKLAGWRVAGWAQPKSSQAKAAAHEFGEERVWMNYNQQGARIV